MAGRVVADIRSRRQGLQIVDWAKKGLVLIQKLVVNILRLPGYAVSLVVPGRKDIWILGAWYGHRYSDNARYLFEYICDNDPSIRAIWLTRERRIVREVRCLGHEAYLINSWKGYWLSCRAGLVIVSSSLVDVNRVATSRAKKILLWHGIPLKKIGLDDKITHPDRSTAYRVTRWFWFLLFPFNNTFKQRWDAIISTSPIVSERICTAFDVDVSEVKITGYPRNDILLSPGQKEAPFIEFFEKSRKAKSVICYVPTFRDSRSTTVDLFSGLNQGKLEDCLSRHNAVMLIKTHYVDAGITLNIGSDSERSRIRWLAKDEAPDLNLLLPYIDIMITDYSGAYIDFLLLNRPIVFAPFDLEYYVTHVRELYENYDAATPGPKCMNWDEVIDALDVFLSGDDPYIEARDKAKSKYHTFADADSCQRVYGVARDLMFKQCGQGAQRSCLFPKSLMHNANDEHET